MSNKKFFIYGAVIFLIIFSLAFVIQQKFLNKPEPKNEVQQDQPRQEIKIMYSITSFSALPIVIAQKAGLFEKYNLPVVLYEQTSPSVSVKSLAAKEIDYLPFASEGTVASQKGLPVKTFMLFSENNPYFLVGQKGSKINDIKNIGLGVGIPMHFYVAKKFILENDIPAEIIYINNVSAVTAALKSGSVDAVIRSIPDVFKLHMEEFPILKDFNIQIGQGLITYDDKIKNNPEEVKKIIQAIKEAISFIKNKPEETKKILLENWKMDDNETNRKIVDDSYDIMKKSFLENGPTEGTAVDMLVRIAKAGDFKYPQDVDGQIVTTEDIAKSFDFSLIK